jgi:hypothetical protein
MRPPTPRHVTMMLVALLLACGATSAFSATVVCSGTVTYLGYQSNGQLMLRMSSMSTWVLVCSLDSDWNVQPGYVTTPAVWSQRPVWPLFRPTRGALG